LLTASEVIAGVATRTSVDIHSRYGGARDVNEL
jgi:hypothetical protein